MGCQRRTSSGRGISEQEERGRGRGRRDGCRIGDERARSEHARTGELCDPARVRRHRGIVLAHGRFSTIATRSRPRRSSASALSALWLMVPSPALATSTTGSAQALGRDPGSSPAAARAAPAARPRPRPPSAPAARASRSMRSKSTTAFSASAAASGAAGMRKRYGHTSSSVCVDPHAARSASASSGASRSQPVSTGFKRARPQVPRSRSDSAESARDLGLAHAGVRAGDEESLHSVVSRIDSRTPSTRKSTSGGAMASGGHQHHHVAQRPQHQLVLRAPPARPGARCARRSGYSSFVFAVLHQLDADHQPALADVAHVLELGDRREPLGEPLRHRRARAPACGPRSNSRSDASAAAQASGLPV